MAGKDLSVFAALDNLMATNMLVYETVLQWKALGLDPDIISQNINRGHPQFNPSDERNAEPAAVVAYGPSLKDTWQDIKRFQTIFTCSGAHNFLLSKGIVPTFHVESDPRAHKAVMLAVPHKDVVYFLASICHANYFELLEKHGANIVVYHLLMTQPKDVYRQFPNGAPLLTGGNIAGVRTIKIARLLGYVNLHMFGFDGSGKHAGEHLNEQPEWKFRTYRLNGKAYSATEHMFVHAEALLQDLNNMSDIEYKFYGDALIPELVKRYARKSNSDQPLVVWKDD